MVSTRRGNPQEGGEEGAPPSQEPNGQQPAEPPSTTRKRSRKQKPASEDAAAPVQSQQGSEQLMPTQPLQQEEPGHGLADGEEVQQQPDEAQAPLDAFGQQPEVAAALDHLLKSVQDPSVFLQPNHELSHAARQAAKVLHQHSSRALVGTAGKHKKDKAELLTSLGGVGKAGSKQRFLPELCVDGAFDAEQIWMQMDLATAAALKRARHMLPTAQGLMSPEGHLLRPEHEAAVDAILAGGGEGSSEQDAGGDESDEDEEAGPSKRRKQVADEEGSDEDMEALLDAGHGRDDYDGGSSDDELLGLRGHDEDGDDASGQNCRSGSRDAGPSKGKLLPTEDQFMRLSEMDEFLQDAERQDARRRQQQNNEQEEGGSEDEGGMDEDEDALLFGSDEEEGQGFAEDMSNRSKKKASKKKGKSAGDAMYADFFGDDRGRGREFWGADDGSVVPRGGMAGSKKGSAAMDPEELEDAPFLVHAAEFDDEDDEGGEGSEEEGGERQGGEEGSSESESEGEEGGGAKGKGGKGAVDWANLSTHEKRQLRVQERVRELEAEAMAEKEWHLRGEVDAQHRPKDSALEVDADFDTTVRPPPEPTEEAMADLEALIKRRIADHQFDDVVRVLPPPPERKRREVELDDNKASKGLGEVYEEQYVKNVVGNTSEDKDERVRNEARMLFQALVGKLDALTHFHFAPKPVVEDLNVRSDVAAVVMEEAAPVAAGNANATMQLPGEVYKPQEAGAPKAEGELTREDRKRQRAQHKRAAKAAKEQKQAERNARALATGQQLPLPSDAPVGAPVLGRKSAALAAATGGKKGAKAAAAAASTALGQGALKHGKTEYGRSSAVFAKLQQEQDQARANGGQLPKKKGSQQEGGKPGLAAAFLKL